MKRVNQSRNFQIIKVLIAVIAVVVFFSACSKNDNDLALTGEAKVRIVNSASGSSAQDFFLENVKVNSEAVAYNQNTAYISTAVGYERKAEFKDSGSTTVNFIGYVDILPGKNYTFFYITKADGTGNSSAVFPDEISASSATKARVRFINLAAGLTAANFLITGGTASVNNIAFGTASAYIDVDPGSVSFETALTGGGSASANLGSFTLQAGKIYTIYTRGSLTATVSAGLLTHN